jgi:hypothetical protein
MAAITSRNNIKSPKITIFREKNTLRKRLHSLTRSGVSEKVFSACGSTVMVIYS